MVELQSGDGYGCTCGQRFADLSSFRKHLLDEGKKEKGKHKSAGRVNMDTGDVVMPPWGQRTEEQKDASQIGSKTAQSKKEKSEGGLRQTSDTDIATEIKVVPRIVTMDYSPIIRSAQAASQREWGWASLPLGNFIDTCIYYFFKEHGIVLQGYYVENLEVSDGS